MRRRHADRYFIDLSEPTPLAPRHRQHHNSMTQAPVAQRLPGYPRQRSVQSTALKLEMLSYFYAYSKIPCYKC
jgi:hypothetical protein